MLSTIKNLFGKGEDYGQLIREGAIIIDVRSKNEYAGGHVSGSVNIPLDQLGNNLNKLKNKDQVIITCCASGMRSASAKKALEQQGYSKVYNGGSWLNLNKYSK
ncbi:MAG TPA: rhodanese-like domain-containing protein [Bacteroidia bacterium]|jgi:phage shock protein E|nr:rhodanese-like domain-containing protein [Bacteroidia bacterium]